MGFTGTYHGDIRPSTKISDIFNSQLPHNHYFIGNSAVIPVTNGLDSYVNGLTIKIILRTLDQSKTVLQVFEENKIENSNDLFVLMQDGNLTTNHAGTIRFQIRPNEGSSDKYLKLITYYLSNTSNVLGQETSYQANPKPTDYSTLCFAISTRKINRATTKQSSLPNDLYSNIKTNMSKVVGSIDNQYKQIVVSPYLFDKITHIYVLKGFVAEVYIEDNYYTSDIDLTDIVDVLREKSLEHANDETLNVPNIDLKSDLSRSIEHTNRITDKYHIYQNIEFFGVGNNHLLSQDTRQLPFVIPKTSYEKDDRVGNTFIFQIKSANSGQLISGVENLNSDVRLMTLSLTGLETGSSMAININQNAIKFAVYPATGLDVNWATISGYKENHVLSVVLTKSIGIPGTRYYVSGLKKDITTNNSNVITDITYTYKQTEPLFADNWTDITVSKGVFVRGGYVCRILVLPFIDDDIDLRRIVQKYSQEYVDMPIGVTSENPIVQYPSQEQSYRTAIKNRLGIINNDEYSMDYILELLTT